MTSFFFQYSLLGRGTLPRSLYFPLRGYPARIVCGWLVNSAAACLFRASISSYLRGLGLLLHRRGIDKVRRFLCLRRREDHKFFVVPQDL